MAQLEYFYGREAEQFAFFTVPKVLFTDPDYKDLPCEAKMLYGMMLDRMSLSIENQWFDEEGRAYIKISEEFVMDNLGCGRNKALNLVKLLEDYDLIERQKRGQGKSSIIFVKRFIRQTQAQKAEAAAHETHIMDNKGASMETEEMEPCTDSDQKSENQTSGDSAPISEVWKLNIKKFKNQTSRSLDTKHQEVYFSNPNNTKNNNTDSNNTQSNLIVSTDSPPNSDAMGYDDDVQRQLQGYSALIKENIDYEGLLAANPYDRELVEGIYDLILETVMCESERILISSNWYPSALVKSKFLKLNYSHIDYAMACFRGNTTKVKNIKKYLLAVLFNAPSTIDGYYRAAVNHDMYSGVI